MSARAWACWLAVMTTTIVGANQPVTMQISPAMSFAPANLVIRTRLEPDVNNRAMEVIAESADFYRSSAIELAGDRAPRIGHVRVPRPSTGRVRGDGSSHRNGRSTEGARALPCSRHRRSGALIRSRLA
jgi:hypothetical protein